MGNFHIESNNTVVASEDKVHETLEKYYQDYSLCIHGIKEGYEPRRVIAEKIVATEKAYKHLNIEYEGKK